MLWTAVDFGLDTPFMERRFDTFNCTTDEGLTFQALFIELASNILVGVGMQKPEGKIFQFPFQFPDAQSIGQRCQQFQRFSGHIQTCRIGMLCVIAQGLRP